MAKKKVIRAGSPSIVGVEPPAVAGKRFRKCGGPVPLRRRPTGRPPSKEIREIIDSIVSAFANRKPLETERFISSLEKMLNQRGKVSDGELPGIARNLEFAAQNAFRLAKVEPTASVRRAYAERIIAVYGLVLNILGTAKMQNEMNTIISRIDEINKTIGNS